MDYIEDDFTFVRNHQVTGTPWWERTLTQMKKQ